MTISVRVFISEKYHKANPRLHEQMEGSTDSSTLPAVEMVTSRIKVLVSILPQIFNIAGEKMSHQNVSTCRGL